MALLDFLKTQPNEQGESQWDWGGKILPGLAAIAGASGSMLNGIRQGNEMAAERRRQSNLDAWNKMIQDEQMKKLQRENATVDITPAMGEQFKDTKYEPFVWNPAETKTQSTQDYLTNVGVMNPGGFNLTGEVTTEKPESLKETSMNRNEYLGMVNDVEAQKAAKYAADLKAWMEQQKFDAQSGKSDEDKRRWEEEQKLARERLNLGWFNANKDQDLTKKDPLLIGFKDLSVISGKKDKFGAPDKTQKTNLSKQYSAAIRSNLNNPEKVKEYIDRYNLLNGTGFTIDNWKVQAKEDYNALTGTPTGKKGNASSNQTASSGKPGNIAYDQNFLNKKGITQVQVDSMLAEAKKKGIGFWDVVKQKYPKG